MRKNLILFMSVGFSIIHMNAQNETTELPETDVLEETNDEPVYTVVEEMPQFPGGDSSYQEFLSKNLNITCTNNVTPGNTRVWVRFTIHKNGTVTNPEIVRGIGGGCDEEAIRILMLMPPWIPGKQSGKLCIVRYTMAIQFQPY